MASSPVTLPDGTIVQIASIGAGQLAYAGYLFNSSWMLSDIGYEIETEPADVPFAAGSWVDPGKPGPKIYTVAGVMGGNGSILDTLGNPITTLDQAQAEVDRLMPLAYFGEQPFQWRSDRYSMAQMSKPKIVYMTGNGYRCPAIQMQFTANDPRSYGNTPYSVPCECLAGGDSVSFSLANVGSYRSYPVIKLTFQASCTNPVIEVDPPSGGAYILTLLGTFATTDTITIVCEPRARSISLDGAKNWSIFQLPIVNTTKLPSEVLPWILGTLEPTTPATSTVKVSATSGRFTATFAYSDCWI